ncbi:MAG TPA: TonB-dependent receptor plug domain-containing protein [Opitutaceae bacterium]|nr:TonB-dependent receptor plug domain-containing protein [Opitutaceae bacterium]
MTSSNRLSPIVQHSLVARACLVALLVLPVRSQVPSAATVDAATLAKYDANKNGVLDPNEQAILDSDRSKGVPIASEEVVSLSPFEVVSDTKGYYASNTMSGTRFNTKLEDLASSITVVTKEQMSDFGMLDINDVFLYTAGTEGTGTYTDFTIDRNGSVSENVSLNPTGANRVRGIGSANISLGNFETMGRMPVDPLILDAVEVSRGPNANVFGLGNPSGTVNQVVAGANLTRNRTQMQLRGDDWGGYRATLDLNRVVKEGVFAFRVNGGFQHDAYQRKPSGQNTVRYDGMIRYQPFKKTRINASYLYYRSNGNRPNASPPRDSVSFWIANGRPTWDPVAQVIHVNGQTLGPFTTDVAPVTNVFNRSFTGSGRFYAYVGQNGLEYIGPGGATLSTNPGTGAAAVAGSTANTVRLQSLNAGVGIVAGRPSGQPLFTTTPSVNDKAIYDWENINLAAINRFYDRTMTSSISLDQNLVDHPMHRLDLQLAAMREDSKRMQRVTVGELNANGQSGQLLIDPNERLLDGTPNPFFLRPYLGIDQPFTLETPQRWDTYRAQLSYQLNLTKENGVLRWLGQHQLAGYDEYKYRVNRRYSWKDGITDAHSWIPAGASRVNQGAITGGAPAAANITRGYWRYYLGDAVGNNVDYGPHDFTYGTYNFRYGNANTGFVSEPVQIARAATTDRAGGGSNTLTIIKTMGGLIQSHFWNDRIVTTFGRRQDRQLVRQGSSPQRLNSDGITFDYESIDHWAPNYRSNRFGKTEQNGVVLKPFRGWGHIDQMAAGGGGARYMGELLRGLTFHYNESNSFTPADPRFSLFLEELPNPHGQGKDRGFSLAMLDNRVVLKVNWWRTAQLANRQGDAGTIAQRTLRHDVASNAGFLLETQATAWVRDDPAHATWTAAQIDAEVSRQMGLSTELRNTLRQYFDAGLISSTNDRTAKGTEIELNYNPTNYWTLAANVTETQQFNANVSADVQQWLDQRLPIWTTIRDPRGNDHAWGTPDDAPVLWWNSSFAGSQTPANNYATFIGSPFNVIKQAEGTADPNVRRYNVRASTNFKLRGITEHKWLKNVEVGGAVRWEDKGAIGYYGIADPAGVFTALNVRRPIYDKAHAYYDLNFRYRTRLWANKVGTSVQLNIRNVQENGRLQAIGAYPDGTPNTYRIVDPRQFILTATFDL